MRDVGDRIKKDGRWPLLIDWSLQVGGGGRNKMGVGDVNEGWGL